MTLNLYAAGIVVFIPDRGIIRPLTTWAIANSEAEASGLVMQQARKQFPYDRVEIAILQIPQREIRRVMR